MKFENTADGIVEKEIIPFLPERVKKAVLKLDRSIVCALEELRLRAGKPVMLSLRNGDGFLHESGQALGLAAGAIHAVQEELSEMVYRICENSWYAFQDDICRGFVTIRGGHRIGLVGSPVFENDRIINIKDISSVNIRVAREITGCGTGVIKHLVRGSRDMFSTLIISPPGAGKTTLLRDIVRLAGNGFPPEFMGMKVGVVDERGEIAACYRGVPRNDLGLRTDVIHGVRKKEGMEILLRSMSPNVIALDELGNPDDVFTLLQVMNAGVRIIATAHGYDPEQLKARQGFLALFQEHAFERFVVITKNGKLEYETRIMDGDGNVLAVDYQSNRKPACNFERNNDRIRIFPEAHGAAGFDTGYTGLSDRFGQ